MSEDATYRLNHKHTQLNSPLADMYASSYLLTELDKLLRDARYCLSHFNLPLPDVVTHISKENRLLLDELSYNLVDMTATSNDNITRLNKNQRHVYDAIYNSIMNDEGKTFFVYGHGGTGKTFL
jgi:hypothetical protein